jgi:hypothetical protein
MSVAFGDSASTSPPSSPNATDIETRRDRFFWAPTSPDVVRADLSLRRRIGRDRAMTVGIIGDRAASG